jgi:kynurenine formamidase
VSDTTKQGFTLQTVEDLCQRHRTWGRWGDDDQRGTLNYIDEACVTRAAALVRRGKVISCAMPYDQTGPQNGGFGRVNPLHFMLQDGGDVAMAQHHLARLRYTDDAVYMPLQCGTQWDALAHIFYEGKMYNWFCVEHVTSSGATRNSIDVIADRVVGRGVLLDIPRHRGVPWLEPGMAIDGDELAACAAAEGVAVGRGDILLVRTGHLALCRDRGYWGDYAAGDAPGLSLASADWLCGKEVAAVATDTWGVEVRPNEGPEANQPWHWVVIPAMGLTMGEMFYLKDLGEDCAKDKIYEFFFCGPPLVITGGTGSPINPQAIK